MGCIWSRGFGCYLDLPTHPPTHPPPTQTPTFPTPKVLHDFEHGGLTNDFLVSSADPLAIVYNDK